MFKKIAGLFLAATMMISTAAISVSAAEVDDAAVAAADQSAAVAAEGSSEVGADSSSEVGAEASSEVGAGNTISFDTNSSGWKNFKIVYCHIWKADGTGSWPSWQSKAERCTYDKNTGIATYDLSKTGNTISKSDGKVYCVIFSVDTGMQTYNAIMSGNCIGDTLYCTGNQIENPEDSEKKAIEAAWKNNTDCGPERKITSTGNVVGSAFPDGESDATMMATYLVAYYDQDAKMDLTKNLLKTLNLDAATTMGAVNDKLDATANPDADKIKKAVADVLAKATGEDASKIQSSAKSSNKTNTNSNTGSTTVKSGQETTIFVVFGGLMLAAAGVMFLSRKKREE